MNTRSTTWRVTEGMPSLPEVHSSLPIPSGPSFLRKLVAFAGPGFLVAVGYMDPGNWATDLAAGSQFNYVLLSVVLISSLMAILLQSLALKLGIVVERDLAQACRDAYSKPVSIGLWVLAEIGIVACDLVGLSVSMMLGNIPISIFIARQCEADGGSY